MRVRERVRSEAKTTCPTVAHMMTVPLILQVPYVEGHQFTLEETAINPGSTFGMHSLFVAGTELF